MTIFKLRPLTPELTAEVANFASGPGNTISERAIALMKDRAQGFALRVRHTRAVSRSRLPRRL